MEILKKQLYEPKFGKFIKRDKEKIEKRDYLFSKNFRFFLW